MRLTFCVLSAHRFIISRKCLDMQKLSMWQCGSLRVVALLPTCLFCSATGSLCLVVSSRLISRICTSLLFIVSRYPIASPLPIADARCQSLTRVARLKLCAAVVLRFTPRASVCPCVRARRASASERRPRGVEVARPSGCCNSSGEPRAEANSLKTKAVRAVKRPAFVSLAITERQVALETLSA